MFRLSCAVVALSLVLGCKNDKVPDTLPPEARQAVKEQLDKVPAAPPAAPVAAPAAAQKLDCQKLLPEPLRAKYFPGTTLTQAEACPGCPMACTLAKGDKSPGAPSVMADCRDRERPEWFERASKALGGMGTPVEGLGRLARAQMKMQVVWIPAKFNCVMTITWMDGGDQLQALAKELDGALSEAALGL